MEIGDTVLVLYGTEEGARVCLGNWQCWPTITHKPTHSSRTADSRTDSRAEVDTLNSQKFAAGSGEEVISGERFVKFFLLTGSLFVYDFPSNQGASAIFFFHAQKFGVLTHIVSAHRHRARRRRAGQAAPRGCGAATNFLTFSREIIKTSFRVVLCFVF